MEEIAISESLIKTNQPIRSTCQCPKWKLMNSQCVIKGRVPTDQLIKRHICFILSSSLTLLSFPSGVAILWTPHFSSCVFNSMTSSIFIWKWFYLLKKWVGVATYFCFIFKRVNKIRKKTLSVTPYFGKSGLWKTGSDSRVRLLVGKVR